MAKTKKKVGATKKPKLVYTASLKSFGRIHKGEGETIQEAIQSLNMGHFVKGVSVLTISKDGVSKDKILTAPQTYRLFSVSRLMKEIALKQISLMFQGL